MNNGYLSMNYQVLKYYYCACLEYSHTNRIYMTEYVNYSHTNRMYTTEYVNYARTLLFVREVNFKKLKVLKYYYCACSEYSGTDRIYMTEYI